MKVELKTEKKEQNRAITLIALVITIIILLILAGVSIKLISGENGLINKTKKSAFVSEMKGYQEETQLYVTGKNMNEYSSETISKISVGLDGQAGIKTILKDLKNKYEDQVIIQEDEMYYKYNGTKESKERVKWCFESNIPVWGYNSYEDFLDQNADEPLPTEIGNKPIPTSEYKKVGNIYMNTPDLSNMNPEATYYVTYDSTGNNPQIAGRIDRVDTPTDWYDYENYKWANIVTVTNNEVAYWVWIPKYTYKTDSDTETVDAKFISKEGDVYKNSSGQIETLTDYKIPESFKFGNTNLPGYWMAKYETSETIDDSLDCSTMKCTSSGNQIIVTSGLVNNGNTSENYIIYIDGVKSYIGTLPYSIPNLKNNKTYDIALAKMDGTMVGRKQVKTTSIKVDISNLNPQATYYVVYDENGENMQIANRIDKGPAPKNWYNYAEKKWANIVTVTNNTIAYWTYIPRYQYKAYEGFQDVDIQFIPQSQQTATEGYKLPESFTFGTTNLAGYWMSKYEVSQDNYAGETISVEEHTNSLTVSTSNPSGNYKVYIDGEVKYTGTLPTTIENLKSNTDYDVFVAKEYGEAIGRKSTSTKSIIQVDLSNLDQANTFYAYWDADGTVHTDIPISQSPPTGWYDYSNKKWANIVTKSSDGNLEAWWVWIPRYEYKTYDGAQDVAIRFITKEQTTGKDGYTIPDAFKFGGQELKGYWMSKYEVSE